MNVSFVLEKRNWCYENDSDDAKAKCAAKKKDKRLFVVLENFSDLEKRKTKKEISQQESLIHFPISHI